MYLIIQFLHLVTIRLKYVKYKEAPHGKISKMATSEVCACQELPCTYRGQSMKCLY